MVPAPSDAGAMTAHRLSQMAHAETDKIDPMAPLEASVGTIKSTAVLLGVANEAAKTGLNLLAANKDRVAQLDAVSVDAMTPEQRAQRKAALLAKARGEM